jgi:hypothetical protein
MKNLDMDPARKRAVAEVLASGSRKSTAVNAERLDAAVAAAVQRAIEARALDPAPELRRPITLVEGVFLRLTIDR